MGMFFPFIPEEEVALIGVEPGGFGEETHHHGATLRKGSVGILHGARTRVLMDAHGQIQESHSLSAGLDYPGVGPEHAFLQATGRARYVSVTDRDAVMALQRLAGREGILCALESAHALAYAYERQAQATKESLLLVNLSGRGDKDLATIGHYLQTQANGEASA